MTGVSYVRPDRRPTWRTTDVLDPSLPADLKASGRMVRVNSRKAFWVKPLMPQRSQQPPMRLAAQITPSGEAQVAILAASSPPMSADIGSSDRRETTVRYGKSFSFVPDRRIGG